MVKSVIKLPVASAAYADVLGLLRPLVDPTRYVSGCTDCCLCESVDDNGQICFTTEWRSLEELERYIRSDAFRAVLAAMDLCTAPPAVRVEEVRNARGMDYIAAVRAAPEAVVHSVGAAASASRCEDRRGTCRDVQINRPERPGRQREDLT
jgi:quinol monooxygenase YgiN